MRLKVKAGQLNEAIKAVCPSVGTSILSETRHYSPVLLRAKGNELRLHASHFSCFSWAQAPAEIEAEGEVAVSGGILRDIAHVESFDPEAVLEIRQLETGEVEIKNGVAYYRLFSAALESISVIEVDDSYTFKFKLGTFREMLTEAAPARGRDDKSEVSPFKWGAIELKREVYEDDGLDVIRAATTDGHRIHIVEADITEEINVSHGDFDILDGRGVLIGSEIIKVLATLPDDEEIVEVAFPLGRSYILLRAGGVVHGVRLVGGNFPPYEKIVEGVDVQETVIVGRAELTKAVRAATILGKGAELRIQATPGELMPLKIVAIKQTENKKKPEMSEIPLVAKYDGAEGFDLSINPGYLKDSLRAMQDAEEVELKFSGDKTPLVVAHRERYFRAFIMPLKIGAAPPG